MIPGSHTHHGLTYTGPLPPTCTPAAAAMPSPITSKVPLDTVWRGSVEGDIHTHLYTSSIGSAGPAATSSWPSALSAKQRCSGLSGGATGQVKLRSRAKLRRFHTWKLPSCSPGVCGGERGGGGRTVWGGVEIYQRIAYILPNKGPLALWLCRPSPGNSLDSLEIPEP